MKYIYRTTINEIIYRQQACKQRWSRINIAASMFDGTQRTANITATRNNQRIHINIERTHQHTHTHFYTRLRDVNAQLIEIHEYTKFMITI